MTARLDESRRRAHKLRNGVQTLLLIGGMALLAAVCAWLLWGLAGLVWAGAAAALLLLLSPQVPPDMVMAMYRARPIGRAEAPDLLRLLDALGERAGLARRPALYYVPSATLNAFSVGRPAAAAIAVTDGLLRRLDLRELAGVLAHELSHIRNDDLRIMGLADTITRVTSVLSYVGLFLLFLNLPLILLGYETIPWLLPILLYLAPTGVSLLQLALSRAREYDADLDAATITGDPAGLASALRKLERYQGRLWESMVFAGRRVPDPSLLRTHPPTEERVRRLLELRPPARLPDFLYAAPVEFPRGFASPRRSPRFRWPGVWY